MRKRLVITLTTVNGSRQYSLGQVARWLALVLVAMMAFSFLVSNTLLVKTADQLSELETSHEALEDQYTLLLGTQQLYNAELSELSDTLHSVKQERDALQRENSQFGAHFTDLSNLLGLDPANKPGPAEADQLMLTAQNRLFLLHSIPSGVPVRASRISDGFGMRMHPVLKKRMMHHGIDFGVDIGTPVYATADGVVEFGGYHRSSGFGRLVIMQHNFGFKSYYAHLSKVSVRSGAWVHKGQLIGYSGNSGRSTGPHLHYEVRHLYTALNPKPFLRWSLNNFDSLFDKVKQLDRQALSQMYPLNQNAEHVSGL